MVRVKSGFELNLISKKKDMRLFTAKVDTNVNYSTGELFVFRIKIISTIQNNGFHVVDATYSTGDLWCELDFTDVDLLVGQEKFEAHRVVLSARSPIFETLLSNISNTGRPTLTIRADVEFTIMEEFLKYLYNGSLEISANNKQLLALAEMYQVETLKEICQLAVREVDVEDITDHLLPSCIDLNVEIHLYIVIIFLLSYKLNVQTGNLIINYSIPSAGGFCYVNHAKIRWRRHVGAHANSLLNKHLNYLQLMFFFMSLPKIANTESKM